MDDKIVKVTTYTLEEGTVLDNRYRILRVIGIGGFGITYEALNEKANIRVAIKEFYDRNYLGRDQKDLVLTDGRKQEDFRTAKEKFLKEARHLGDFSDEAGVVSVIDYFEENNTAYIVMEYLSGLSLQQYFEREKRVEGRKLFQMFLPLMETLDKIHKNGVLHRDISPDNIKFDETLEENLKLIDFGAARDYLQDTTYTVELKDGYAPVEQYDGHEQGPWTDVYGLSAVLYHGITGQRPLSSLGRSVKDELKMPSQLGIKIDPRLEKILKKGLAVKKEKRYQSVEEMLRELTPILNIRKKKKSVRKEKIFLVVSCLMCIFVAAGWGAWKYYQENLAFFKFYGEQTETVLITPYGDVSNKNYQKDLATIQERLEYLFGSNNYIAKENENGLEVVMPLSYFEELDYDDLESAIDQQFLMVAGAHKMEAIVAQINESSVSFLGKTAINREDITSVKKKTGDMPVEYNLPESVELDDEIVGYVEIELTEEAADRLRGNLQDKLTVSEKSDNAPFMRLVTDLDMGESVYYGFCTDPDGDWSVFYQPWYSDSSRWKSLWKTSELSDSYCVTAETPTQWEESSGMWGENQCKENEIEGSAVCTEYELSWGTENEDTGAWLQIIYDIKTKMDALEVPYAFGLGSGDNKKIVIKTSQKDLNDALRQNLTGSLYGTLYLISDKNTSAVWKDISSSNTEIDFNDDDPDHCKLTFKLYESLLGDADPDSFNEWKKELGLNGEDKIYLMYGGYPLSEISAAEAENNTEVVFETNLWNENGTFTIADRSLANYLQKCQELTSDNAYIFSKEQYITADQTIALNADEIKNPSEPQNVQELIEQLHTLLEESGGTVERTSWNELWNVEILLNMDTESRFADQMTSTIEKIIESYGSELKEILELRIYPGNRAYGLKVSLGWSSYFDAYYMNITSVDTDNSEHLTLKENLQNSKVLQKDLNLTDDHIYINEY